MGPEKPGPISLITYGKSSVTVVPVVIVMVMPLAAVAFNSPGAVLVAQVKRTQEWTRIEFEERRRSNIQRSKRRGEFAPSACAIRTQAEGEDFLDSYSLTTISETPPVACAVLR